jgi:hypothetical protein
MRKSCPEILTRDMSPPRIRLSEQYYILYIFVIQKIPLMAWAAIDQHLFPCVVSMDHIGEVNIVRKGK